MQCNVAFVHFLVSIFSVLMFVSVLLTGIIERYNYTVKVYYWWSWKDSRPPPSPDLFHGPSPRVRTFNDKAYTSLKLFGQFFNFRIFFKFFIYEVKKTSNV